MKKKFGSLSQYIEYLQSQGRYWFLRNDAIDALGITQTAFRFAAYRMIKKGKLNKIRGEFYTLVPAEYYAIGTLPATWFIDAFMKYLSQEYYVGLVTAASLHGVAHQQPMVFQVITDKRTRSIKVGRVRIEFFYKKMIEPDFYQAIKTATGMMSISTLEMTAFDLIRYIDASGQVNHIATVLSELGRDLKSDILAKIVERDEVEVSVAQRLGYLLDILELPINLELLYEAIKIKKPKSKLLVTNSQEPVIELNQRWHILVNEKVEADEL